MSKLYSVVVCFLISVLCLADGKADVSINDDFSDPGSEVRQASRGEWKYADNEASCVADPELYEKFKNHGPIIRWPVEFVDGKVSFEMKAKDCQRIVFTFNGDGHIFRVATMGESGDRKVVSRVLLWETKSSKTNKGDTVKPEGLPDVATINNKWVKYSVEVKAGKATLQIGEFKTEVEHAALKRDKTEITLSFASGELAMRNFVFGQP